MVLCPTNPPTMIFINSNGHYFQTNLNEIYQIIYLKYLHWRSITIQVKIYIKTLIFSKATLLVHPQPFSVDTNDELRSLAGKCHT